MASLKKTVNAWARKTGFVKRKRTFKAYEFLLLMVVGQMGMKHPSLAGMVASIKAGLSREAFHKRFSPQAVAFMHSCLLFALKKKVNQGASIEAKALRAFSKVVILDSSAWNLHPSLAGSFPGTGGDGSGPTCKLQAFYLCRLLAQTSVHDPDTMDAIPLDKLLAKVNGDACEMNVVLGSEQSAFVSCRLICLRVSEEVANKRRRDLKARTSRRRKGCTKKSLALCGWTLLITNAPPKRLSAAIAFDRYMLRWQIELLFKQLKSILQIHHSNTGREHRLRCELYGKLIGAILVHRIHASIHAGLWNRERKELSFEKLYKRIQERAFMLMTLLISAPAQAVAYLGKELSHIARHCLKASQPSRPTTLQLLDRTGQFNVEVLTMAQLS